MFGAILGDMIGEPYEFAGIKRKDFPLIGNDNNYTDDSVMTVAVAAGIMEAGINAEDDVIRKAIVDSMQRFGRKHPYAGYGGMFRRWLQSDNPQPYNSYGNGSAMRVSSIAWFYPDDLSRALHVAKLSAEVTHNHPEGIKAAEAATAVIWMANAGYDKNKIKEYIEKNCYRLDETCDEIRLRYRFDVTSQGTMPPAIQAFMEGTCFEDVVRTGVSLGGDSDTIGAICGAMAEAYYGIPHHLKTLCFRKISREMARTLDEFQVFIRERDFCF